MALTRTWSISCSLLGLGAFIAGCSPASGDRLSENTSPTPLPGTGGASGGSSSSGGSGNESGSGTSGFVGVSGDGQGAAGSGGNAAFPECDAQIYSGERLPMDMYIMFDQSVSMSCATSTGGDRWTAVRVAMENFVNSVDANGIGVGIGYFGNVGVNSGQPVSCDPAVYEIPDAEIAPLPGNAQAIVDSLNRHGPSSTTPTPPALAGALNHAIFWRDMNGRPTIVVLVTDGQPNDCGVNGATPTPQDVANVAGAGLSGAGMQTYVLGIIGGGIACEWDPNPPNQADLDLVAQAGGTNAAFIVDAAQDVSAQFLAKMNEIRSSAQPPCEYLLPTDKTTVDTTKVNLSYTPPGGEAQQVLYASDPSICDATNGGWYYDDPSAPTRAILCPSTCNVIKAQTGGVIELVLGCPTEPIR